MNITFQKGEFVARCVYAERVALKRAGFSFNKADGVFTTPSRTTAARLRAYCDTVARKEIDRALIQVTPWTGRLPIPPGRSLLDFQPDACRFALARNRSYLALDPGLGKSIIAATVINALKGCFVVYVCPPFLAMNVEDEIAKWSSPSRQVRIFGRDRVVGRTFIVPDSRLDRRALLKVVIAMRVKAARLGVELVLVVDEAHRFNGPNAIRSMALYEDFVPLFDRVIHMSGTPMNNRPMDLFTVLSNCAPETIKFMDRFEFGRKFCAGKRNRFGWDFKGASNVKELARAIRPKYMLRIRADVLALPPLRQEFVFVGGETPTRIAPLEAAILREQSPSDLLAPTMSAHVSTYRKELGALKVKPSLPFITSLLEDTEEAFLLGVVHRAVVTTLLERLAKYRPLVIDGSVPSDKRLAIAKEFQANPRRRFIIMNLQAGGIGFNLTRASRVVLLEYSWVPSVNRQFIGRALRYGQKRSVLGQYLVFRNSLDRKVLETGFRKEAITSNL